MKLDPGSIARASSRHPWRTLGVWVVVIVAMAAVGSRLLSGVLTDDDRFTNDPESQRAQAVLDARFGANGVDTEYVLVHSGELTVDDPRFEAAVRRVQARVAGIGRDVLAAAPATYYDVAGRSPDAAAALVSQDRRTTLVPVELTNDEEATATRLREAVASSRTEGFTLQVAGEAVLGADITKIAEEDLSKGEMAGIGIALIVLVVVFGSVVAAVAPIALGLAAVMVALGIVALIGQVFSFNVFVENMTTMIGLAVGIDYSLFIVSRYREERRKGFDKLDAIAAAGATANRAVFFSGLTVVLALMGMLIIPVSTFRSLAGAAILVTIAALAASMTLLPAVLSLLGDRLNWPRLSRRARMDADHDPRGRFWDRLTRGVMARPVVFLMASVLVLGGLGAFMFQLNRGSSASIGQLPDVPSKAAFISLQRDFGGDRTAPARIVVTGDVSSPDVRAAIGRLQRGIASDATFAPQSQVQASADRTAIVVDAYFRGNPSNEVAVSGVRDLRGTIVPTAFDGVRGVDVLVGGEPAAFADFLDVANRYQWIVLVFVLGLSFLLLTAVFRSIVVPLKAIAMNLLSVGAAYGALVLVFQKGVGLGVFHALGFDFQRSPAIEAWLPLMMFSVLFGLSMDYHVFLLTRIREEYDETHDNAEAVAYGLRTTAGIITGAALIMVAVFTGLAAGRLGPLQQMGFGLGVAVLMDATIVRTLLVPASMWLLGDWNWYLPRWLGWLPRLEVEGHEPTQRVLRPRVEPVVVDVTELVPVRDDR